MNKTRRSGEGESYLIVPRKFNGRECLLVLAYFALLFLFSHLQYDNFRLQTVIYPLLWLSGAFVVYKALFERSRERRGIMRLGRIIGFFVLLYYCIPLTGFCAYMNYGTSYVNQKDSSVTITTRGYGCFMTDVDVEYVLERKLTTHLKWITALDVKHMDPATWRKITE